MSKATGSAAVPFRGFLGTDETGASGSAYVRESMNVEFVDGKMRRRKGRSKLLSTASLKPTKAVLSTGGGATVTDITTGVTDGDFTTTVVTNFLTGATDELYVGMPFRFTSAYFYISGTPLNNTTLQVAYFDRGSGAGTGAWTNAILPRDNTAVGGFTMKQPGWVHWGISEVNSDTWTPGGVTGTAAIDAALDQDLFWVRFKTAAALGNGVSLAELQGSLLSDDGTVSTGSSGLVEFTTRTGERRLITTQIYPGQSASYTDAWTEVRVIAYDLSLGIGIPLRIPQALRMSVRPIPSVSYASFNGWLIGATPDGQLWKYNGTLTDRLEFMPGVDAQSKTPGALTYLQQGPRGTMLEVYRNRLMVAGDPDFPLTFYASMEDNNISMIPAEATVGGPNVWPLRYVFNIASIAGDYIVGARVINDTYVILTRFSVWAFNDESLRNSNIDYGCVAPASIQKIDNRIFFLSEHGVAVTNGADAEIISDPVSKTLETVNFQNVRMAVSVHDAAKNEYWLWLPIHGGRQNSLAIVYQYEKKSWRVVAGWYPWDTTARRSANSDPLTCTAACSAIGNSGRNIIVTSDFSGDLWQENVGLDDDGVIFPAYAILNEIVSPDAYTTAREWSIDVATDGQWFEFYALGNDETLGRELDRRYSNVATDSEVVHKQALLSKMVSAGSQATFADGSGTGAFWSISNARQFSRRMKASFGRALASMRPAIVWAPGNYSAGSYINQVAALGEISGVATDVGQRGVGR